MRSFGISQRMLCAWGRVHYGRPMQSWQRCEQQLALERNLHRSDVAVGIMSEILLQLQHKYAASSVLARHQADKWEGDSAKNVNFKVMACSQDTYCCSYPNSYYPLAGQSFDCCNDTTRVFNAGPANFLAGYAVNTQLFVGPTTVSGFAMSTSTQASASSATGSSASGSTSSSTSSSTVTSSTSSSSSTTSSNSASTSGASSSTMSTEPKPTSASDANQTTSSPSSTTTTPAAKSGLSTGASAGIAVGATLGALALIGIGVLVGLRLRKRSNGAQNTSSEGQAMQGWNGEWSAQPRYSPISPRWYKVRRSGIHEAGWQPPSEVDSVPRGELEGHPVEKGCH